MTKRTKLTAAEKKKRAERNERRGRNAERKSEDKPRIAKKGLVFGKGDALGLGVSRRRQTESSQRAVMATVDHASKWKGTPPCGCNRCVERRALEAEAEQAVNAGRHRLKQDAA